VLGSLGALYAPRWPDVTVRGITVLAASVPSFVIGLLFLEFVVVQFGFGEVVANGSLHEVLLPATCVATNSLAVPTRVLRASIVTALRENYSLVSRARGASRLYVVLRHGLPNAAVPFINALALSAPWMIGGTVVVETVFTWPGLGAYLVQSVEQRDIPVVQAIVLLVTLAYLAASLVADVLTRILDPRLGSVRT
jgi:ABC-type dipeptide/oligopeptide/nickel transport system permease component